MDCIIRATQLGKKYRIHHHKRAHYETLRDILAEKAKGWIRKTAAQPAESSSHEDFWALSDVSFAISSGDRLGIIGRNGAGKTTLLKILSRITEPSTGRVEIRGRVASLLEVGTGFHPELSGRENIFLNGAILGMRRQEIIGRFDEIVAFAEVEKFLDTPVKHYSSGMYVRLAFSVAAHLESNILLVDEVLAVGDAAFQKKCLEKMKAASQNEGRTVLFISHNLTAIASLCSHALLLKQGKMVSYGAVGETINRYQDSIYQELAPGEELANLNHYGNGKAKFQSLAIEPLGKDGCSLSVLKVGQRLRLTTRILAREKIIKANIAAIIYDASGYRVIDVNTALKDLFITLQAGQQAEISFDLRDILLKPGTYFVGLWAGRANIEDIDGILYAKSFSVEIDPDDIEYSQIFPGVYQCRFETTIK